MSKKWMMSEDTKNKFDKLFGKKISEMPRLGLEPTSPGL